MRGRTFLVSEQPDISFPCGIKIRVVLQRVTIDLTCFCFPPVLKKAKSKKQTHALGSKIPVTIPHWECNGQTSFASHTGEIRGKYKMIVCVQVSWSP